MRFLILLYTVFLVSHFGISQRTIPETLDKFNKNSVDYIAVDDLLAIEEAILLDTRKRDEYEVSHLRNAHWVGHKKFNIDSVFKIIPDKKAKIIVYCSVGVRSENIGERLQQAGYSNVRNLYGGIFQWKNKGYPVFDMEGRETEKVHAFSKHWGKLLTNGEKVYKTKSN